MRARAATAGLIATALALGIGEFIAGLQTAIPSPLTAIGQVLIPRFPSAVTEWAIDTFGTADRAVLIGGITVLALLIGAITGARARRSFGVAVTVFVLFGAFGVLASLSQPGAVFPLVLITMVVAVSGALWALHRMLRAAEPAGQGKPITERRAGGSDARDTLSRRSFVRNAVGAGAAAVVLGTVGRGVLSERTGVDPRDVSLPEPARALPDPDPATSLDVDGISPLFTPNPEFYRIDTAISVPEIGRDGWSVRTIGLVDEEIELTYDDVLGMPLEEIDITMQCVSMEIGGDLIGNARWTGVRLADLLERAGVQDGAEQVIGRSVGGWTGGFPVEAATDDRGALLAVGMNGEALPTEHGYPARLIVPGLYGYVSATKWVSEIELTTSEAEGYWIPRGWAKDGTIKTASRIDVPTSSASVDAGDVVVAGVAWAPTRGISRVEVRVDEGDWQEAELSEPLNEKTWVQWRRSFALEPGRRNLQVRAVDGEGHAQPQGPQPSIPSGAEGWHEIAVDVA